MEAARGSDSRLGFKRKPTPSSPATEGRVCDTRLPLNKVATSFPPRPSERTQHNGFEFPLLLGSSS